MGTPDPVVFVFVPALGPVLVFVLGGTTPVLDPLATGATGTSVEETGVEVSEVSPC